MIFKRQTQPVSKASNTDMLSKLLSTLIENKLFEKHTREDRLEPEKDVNYPPEYKEKAMTSSIHCFN